MEAALQEAEGHLRQHLQDVRRQLGAGASVSYVPLHKETHVLEIPQVPSRLWATRPTKAWSVGIEHDEE